MITKKRGNVIRTGRRVPSKKTKCAELKQVEYKDVFIQSRETVYMEEHDMKKSVFLAVFIMVLVLSISHAQQQPDVAVNQQDEVVNINAPPAGDDGRLTIFRSGNKQEISHYISKVIEIKNGAALELMPHVRQAVDLEKGGARAMRYDPPGGGKTRYFIQVVTTREQMPSVIKTIKDLDLPDVKGGVGDVKHAIRMRYRRATEVAEVLRNTQLSGLGNVYGDDTTNTLFVVDLASEMVGDLAYIEFYDVPSPQVQFDVQIVEVKKEDAGKIGLDWEAWKRSVGGQIDFTGNRFEGGDTFARIDSLLTIDASALADFLNYTAQQGNADIIKRVKVTSNNVIPAVVSTSKRVPYYSYERTDRDPGVIEETNPNVDGAGEVGKNNRPFYPLDNPRAVSITPASTFTRTDTGIDLEGIAVTIQPVIGTEMVTAHIDIKANTLSGFDEQDRPIVEQQEFSSAVTLQNNQPLHIGTVEKSVTLKYRRGIPGLRSVPWLKYLFSVEGTKKEESKLYIIATPCFCNQMVYEARRLGEGKDILKQVDNQAPEYIKRSMLPLQ